MMEGIFLQDYKWFRSPSKSNHKRTDKNELKLPSELYFMNYFFFLLLFTISLAFAQNVKEAGESEEAASKLCSEMLKYTNDKKSFEEFQAGYPDFEKNVAATWVNGNMLGVHYRRIADDIQNKRNALVECNFRLNSYIPVLSIAEAKPFPIGNAGAIDIFNVPRPVLDSTIRAAAESNAHCAEKIGPKELKDCTEDIFPPRVLGLPASYKYLVAVDKWQSSSKVPDKFSTEDCGCLKTKMKDNMPTPEELKKVDEKLNAMILKASGQKLLNQYAANYEDVSFYLNNKATVFSGGDRSRPGAFNYDLLCNNSKDLKTIITYSCEVKKIPQADIEKRMNILLGSLGTDFSGTTIDQKFKIIGEEISTYKADPKKVLKGQPTVFTREKFDEMRNGLSQSEPEVPFVNNLATAIVHHKTLSKHLQEAIKDGLPPYRAILNLLSNPEYKDAFRGIFKKISNDHPNLNNFIAKQVAEKNYSETVNVALNLHPGLKTALNNGDFFLNLEKLMQEESRNTSLLTVMEEDKEALTEHFKEKCQTIRNDLAEAVCTPEDDILGRANTKDIAYLMSKEKMSEDERIIYDLNICLSANNKRKIPAFNDLVLTDHYGFSDFYDRKMHPESEQNNAFNNAYKKMTDKNSKSVQNYVSKVTQQYASSRIIAPMSFEKNDSGKTVLRSLDPAEDSVKLFDKEDLKRSTTGIAKLEDAITSASKPNALLPKNLPESFNQSGYTPNQMNQTTDVNQVSKVENTITGVTDGASAQPRNEITEFLNPGGTKPETQKLLNNISDRDVDEILNLKEQMQKDKNLISKLQLEAEKKKTDELKDKFEQLQKKYDTTFKNKTDTHSTEPQQNANFGIVSGFKDIPSQNGKPSILDGNNFNGGTIKSAGRNISSAATSNKPSIIEDQAGIIIESNVNSQEKHDEEVYTYLMKNEQDVQTLEKFKEIGVTYKHEVIVNGKRVIEEKLVPYSELSPKVRELLARKLLVQVKRTYSIQALKYELMVHILNRKF